MEVAGPFALEWNVQPTFLYAFRVDYVPTCDERTDAERAEVVARERASISGCRSMIKVLRRPCQLRPKLVT